MSTDWPSRNCARSYDGNLTPGVERIFDRSHSFAAFFKRSSNPCNDLRVTGCVEHWVVLDALTGRASGEEFVWTRRNSATATVLLLKEPEAFSAFQVLEKAGPGSLLRLSSIPDEPLRFRNISVSLLRPILPK